MGKLRYRLLAAFMAVWKARFVHVVVEALFSPSSAAGSGR